MRASGFISVDQASARLALAPHPWPRGSQSVQRVLVGGTKRIIPYAPYFTTHPEAPEWGDFTPRPMRIAKANQVNAAFNWAVRCKCIAENPLRGVSYAEAKRRPCLDDATFQQMVEAAGEHFGRVLWFLRLTGMALADVCKLKWPQIDFERSKVVYTKRYTANGTKRRVRLDELVFNDAAMFYGGEGLSSIRVYLRSSTWLLVARIHWPGAEAAVKIIHDRESPHAAQFGDRRGQRALKRVTRGAGL